MRFQGSTRGALTQLAAVLCLLTTAACATARSNDLLTSPTDRPTPAATPSPWEQTHPPEPEVDDGLLRAQDLAAAGLGVWSVQTLTDPEGGVTDCMRAAAGEALAQGYPEAGRWSRATREADSALVQQSTARHPSSAVAAAQLAAHVDAVRACPSEEILDWPGEPRVVLSTATHEVVEQSPELLLVRTRYACETCDGRTTYLAVARTGTWLTVLNVPAGDEQDPAALARAVVRAATARLAAAPQAP